MDRIFIENLSFFGKHGVSEKERSVEQEFLIDVAAEFGTAAAAASDALTDTVNYSDFAAIAREAVEENSFFLIERLGERIARRILEDARIVKVEVTVRKPAVLANGVPGVTIIRIRS